MDYRIHNLVLVRPGNQQDFFEESIRKKIRQLEKVLKGYTTELMLEIVLKQGEGSSRRIELSLPMNGKTLVVDGWGGSIAIVINDLMDRLGDLVKKQLSMEQPEYLHAEPSTGN